MTNLVKAILHIVAEIAYRSIYAMETIGHCVVEGKCTVTNTLLNATDAILKIIERKFRAEIGACQCTLSRRAVDSAAAKTSPSAVAPSENHLILCACSVASAA